MNTSTQAAPRTVLLLLMPLLSVAGCDSIVGTDEGIEGTWVDADSTESDTSYLEITSTTLKIASDNGSCYQFFVMYFLDHTGDDYRVEHPQFGDTVTYTLQRVGEDLRMTAPSGASGTLRPSSQDVSQLQRCPLTLDDAGGDPDIVCSDLPVVTFGETVHGELTAGDATVDDRYYDLYGLTLGAGTQVQIDAAADSIDTHLYLYEASGIVLAAHEDDPGFGAHINKYLAPGCYRIEVRNDWLNTGSYTLTVH